MDYFVTYQSATLQGAPEQQRLISIANQTVQVRRCCIIKETTNGKVLMALEIRPVRNVGCVFLWVGRPCKLVPVRCCRIRKSSTNALEEVEGVLRKVCQVLPLKLYVPQIVDEQAGELHTPLKIPKTITRSAMSAGSLFVYRS